MPTTMPGARPTIAVSGSAEPVEVARLRAVVSDWIDDVVPVSCQRRADILLATDEAMSNCADHAYRDHRDPGSVSVEVTFHHDSAHLVVRVADHGRWVVPATRSLTALRGRGITLMNALADDVTIDGRRDGTSVCLHFSECR